MLIWFVVLRMYEGKKELEKSYASLYQPQSCKFSFHQVNFTLVDSLEWLQGLCAFAYKQLDFLNNEWKLAWVCASTTLSDL